MTERPMELEDERLEGNQARVRILLPLLQVDWFHIHSGLPEIEICSSYVFRDHVHWGINKHTFSFQTELFFQILLNIFATL